MTKKFIALVLSLVFMVSMLPTMSVSAESTTVSHFNEDFETWITGTKFNENYDYPSTTNSISSDGTYGSNSTKTRFSLGKFFFAEVVSMPGYDGSQTKAIKLTASSDGSRNGWQSSKAPGAGRFIYSAAAKVPTTGKYVQEFSFYHGENDIHKFSFGKVAIVGGKLVDASGINQNSDYTTVENLEPGWNKIVVVNDLDNRKVILYLNGKNVSYNKRSHAGDSSFGASTTIQVGSYNVENWTNKSLIFDDFNIYSNPDATVASSAFDGAQSILANSNVTVDFSNQLLVTTISGNATVSTSNVTVTDSQGDPVEIEKVTAAQDEKSIVIEPVSDFAKGATYTVNVSGLRDMYDNEIAAYNFSFTTAEDANISVSDVKFEKVDFENSTIEEINALENGYVNVSYSVTNNAASAKNIIMLAVLKDNDAIERFQFKPVTLGANAELNFNGGFYVEDSANKTVEIYIWDDMCNMTPIAAKYVINSTGTTIVPIN